MVHYALSGYRSGIYLLLNPRIYQTYPYLLLDDFLPPAGLRVEIHSEQETQKGATSPIFLWPGGQMVIAMTAEKRRIKARTRRSLPFQNTEMPCVSKGEYKWFKTGKGLGLGSAPILTMVPPLQTCHLVSYVRTIASSNSALSWPTALLTSTAP